MDTYYILYRMNKKDWFMLDTRYLKDGKCKENARKYWQKSIKMIK